MTDCVIDTGQLNTEIIPQIPRSYRAMYVHQLILYIDAAAFLGIMYMVSVALRSTLSGYIHSGAMNIESIFP